MATSIIAPILASAAPALVRAGAEAARSRRELRERGPLREQKPARARRALPRLGPIQVEAGRAIVRETLAYPLPEHLGRAREALALALLVNAWAESRLRPGAQNSRGEESIGLFQINRRAHPQHARAQLRDASYNTRAFLEILARQDRRFAPISTKGATLAELTALVTYWGERPKRRIEASVERAARARAWFGALADRPAASIRL